MSRILHLVAASLQADAPAEGRRTARALAEGLREADRVESVVVAVSDTHIVVATWLPERAALEPFAASPAHMAFIMKGLAPVIERMWSAAVETEAPPPGTPPAALWVFAIGAADSVFEWQMRELLAEAEALPGTAAAGATVEERDRYRAAGLVALQGGDIEALRGALPAVRERWSAVAGTLEEAFAPVDGAAAS